MDSIQATLFRGNAPIGQDLKICDDNHRELRVYISHKNDIESKPYLQGLCNALLNENIGYIVDTKDALYRMKLIDFENFIADGIIVVAIINQSYLESLECMYELAKTCEYGHIEDRFFPLITCDIDRSGNGLLNQKIYWNSQLDRLCELARKLGPNDNIICLHDITRISIILRHLSDIWIYFKEYLTSTKEKLVANNYALMISSIKERINNIK